jgi:multidrug efflux pump subunit AcrB
MFFLTGVAKFLFVPLGEAVVFAMLASYGLSRTLVPTLAKYWLKERGGEADGKVHRRNFLSRFQGGFERGFDSLRDGYRATLEAVLVRRRVLALGFLAFVAVSFAMTPWLGNDFFPTVDGGQLKLHLRARSGTRIEETARLCDQVDAAIRRTLPAGEIDSIVDNVGLPVSGINLSYSNSAPIGTGDADILISLKPDHQSIEKSMDALRTTLTKTFPGVGFAFLPADMVGQILNFGAPAPVDIQITGRDAAGNAHYAQSLLEKLKHVPGIADLRIQQPADQPTFHVDVDRSRAQELGLTQRDVANDLLISLSGSFQTAPTFWLNPKNGVSYSVVTQTPQYQLDSLDALRNVPITGPTANGPQILGALAEFDRDTTPAVVSHYNVQPMLDIFASVRGRDLGGVSGDVNRILSETAKEVPHGSNVTLRGQVATMDDSYTGLYEGLALAILLVYFLIVVNFQSWIDPLIIITALPAALAGIVWMLFVTGTTLSVPALTGAIMTVGVATANSILVISFARERIAGGADLIQAALDAGFTRFRPVLMTALAMMIGMVPMALGLGEGGEQNAPLGRAVIGGLLFATPATLFFVPMVFCLVHSLLQERRGRNRPRPEPARP